MKATTARLNVRPPIAGHGGENRTPPLAFQEWTTTQTPSSASPADAGALVSQWLLALRDPPVRHRRGTVAPEVAVAAQPG